MGEPHQGRRWPWEVRSITEFLHRVSYQPRSVCLLSGWQAKATFWPTVASRTSEVVLGWSPRARAGVQTSRGVIWRRKSGPVLHFD
jgi:hypothetical protein